MDAVLSLVMVTLKGLKRKGHRSDSPHPLTLLVVQVTSKCPNVLFRETCIRSPTNIVILWWLHIHSVSAGFGPVTRRIGAGEMAWHGSMTFAFHAEG